MKKHKLAVALSVLGLSLATTPSAQAGFVALEGSDATALHRDTSYTPNLFGFLRGSSSLPVLILGTIDISSITGVPVVTSTTLPGSLSGVYSAVYIESPFGCCTADNTVLNGNGALMNTFIGAGGNLAIENYIGGSYDGVVPGGSGADGTNTGGIGTGGPGPGCTDGETTTALGLSKGFTQPPVDGCWEHQGYRNGYWNSFGYISLIAADPAFFGASSDLDPTAGGSGLLALGGTLGSSAPEPASFLLMGSAFVGLGLTRLVRRRNRQR
jgi:hypothetical protein